MENRSLAVKPEYRPVHVGNIEQNACVIHEITGRKIIRSVDDKIVIFDNVKRIFSR